MNGPLTAVEWAAVAFFALAAIAVIAYLDLRARREASRFREFTLHGPAVTDEMRRTFGAYGSSEITGLIVLNDGIRVGFEDGSSVRFIPVPDGATLYVNDKGEFVVEPPADDD